MPVLRVGDNGDPSQCVYLISVAMIDAKIELSFDCSAHGERVKRAIMKVLALFLVAIVVGTQAAVGSIRVIILL